MIAVLLKLLLDTQQAQKLAFVSACVCNLTFDLGLVN